MALIIINPADVAHNTSGAIAFDCIQSTLLSLWRSRIQLYSIMESIIRMIYDASYVSIPAMLSYWHARSRIFCRWYIISWQLWIIWISAIWLEPPLKKGKHYNGTYWVGPKADLFENKAQLKDLARRRRRLDRDSCFVQSWNKLWFPLYVLILNLCAVAYFAIRIFRYKLGYLASEARPKSTRQKQKTRTIFRVYNTVMNIDKIAQQRTLSFDTDASNVICDNSANVHICNDKSMFVGTIRHTDKHYVATIGGNKNAATGMGTVRWRWKDDTGKQHTTDVRDVLLFLQSPVNILSITALAEQFKDDEGTGIDTKRSKSLFYWNENRFHRTIHHPSSNLPELPINEGFTIASLFSKMVGMKVCLTKQHCHCHNVHLIPDDREPVPSLELSDQMFHVGETLLYINSGQTAYVRVEKIYLDEDATLRIQVRSKNDELIETTKESLRSPSDPDIGWIPTSIPEKKATVSTLSDDDIKKISDPVTLSPLQEEFLALHERLWHLPFSVMFRLESSDSYL